MKKLLFAAILCAQNLFANVVVVTPDIDGEVYSTGVVFTGTYLAMGLTTQGVLKFSPQDFSSYASVDLVLNPYALPAPNNIDIYGLTGSDTVIRGDDFNSGTYLGTLVLPANLAYGQLLNFDVTDFAKQVSGQYFGFDLRGGYGDVMSSLAYNYGTPAELVASTPDLPSSFTVALAIGFCALLQFFRKDTSRA